MIYSTEKKSNARVLIDYLRSEGYELKLEDLSGFDDPFKASLNSYISFGKIFGKRIREYPVQQMVENIILWLTLYGEDKSMLTRIIRKHYSENEISSDQLKDICRLSYQGWGRLSRELLQELEGTNKETGETMSIIQALRVTSDNLMQILSDKYTFSDEMQKENNVSS